MGQSGAFAHIRGISGHTEKTWLGYSRGTSSGHGKSNRGVHAFTLEVGLAIRKITAGAGWRKVIVCCSVEVMYLLSCFTCKLLGNS